MDSNVQLESEFQRRGFGKILDLRDETLKIYQNQNKTRKIC